MKAIAVTLARTVLADYPKLRLCLTEGLSGSVVMHLVNSDVDIALVYNPTAEPALKTTPVLEERLVCVGTREIIGDTDAPITFAELLELPLLSLRPGLSTRALVDDPGLLKKRESRAMLQMNSLQAIGGSLIAGLGCLLGTKLIMQEHL